jgi:predicted transcriptional regulator
MHAVKERPHRAGLSSVTNDENAARRQAIKERFQKLGLTDREWYRLTDIPRQTLNKTISGEVKTHESTFVAIEAALDKLEAQAAGKPVASVATDTEVPRVVTFEMTKGGRTRWAMSWPVEDMAEMEPVIARLMQVVEDDDEGDS